MWPWFLSSLADELWVRKLFSGGWGAVWGREMPCKALSKGWKDTLKCRGGSINAGSVFSLIWVTRCDEVVPLRRLNGIWLEGLCWRIHLKCSLPCSTKFWEVLRCDDLSLQVDTSLQNGFAPGMKLEVAVKSDQNTYWVATIITTCGQLLLLRYDGYGEDRKADFWCDIMTADLHPIGWCEQNEKVLKVPEGNASMCRRGR